MAEQSNPYLDGRLNLGATGEVKALHQKPQPSEKPTKLTGKDLRAGTSGK